MQKKAKVENKSANPNLLNNNSNGSDSDCVSNDKIDAKEEKSRYLNIVNNNKLKKAIYSVDNN